MSKFEYKVITWGDEKGFANLLNQAIQNRWEVFDQSNFQNVMCGTAGDFAEYFSILLRRSI